MTSSTAEKILTSAEQLFADDGVDGTSLRKIVRTANVNIAAIHYHFGSKNELVEAVLTRRLQQVNGARAKALQALQTQHGPAGTIPVAALMRAFLRPVVMMAHDDGPAFFRMIARAHSEANQHVREVMLRELSPIIALFMTELTRALPDLTPAQRGMRLSFVAGAMVHATLWMTDETFCMKMMNELPDTEALLEELVCFCAGGLLTPEGIS